MVKKAIYKTVLLVLVITSIILLLDGCTFVERKTNIKTGFSDKLKNMLIEQYELNIPDSAVFTKGYFTNAFRDPSVKIAFSIPLSDFESIFVDNWSKEDISSYSDDWYKELTDEKFDQNYVYDKKQFTVLFFKVDEGTVLCAFSGHHPGDSFS